MKNRIIKLVWKFYKLSVSPYLPSQCRYYPTCSGYSYEALSEYGIIKGIYMTILRIAKCRPSKKIIFDPVKIQEKN